MTDGDMAFHRGQCLLIEHLADQTQVLNTSTCDPSAYSDARRLLPPVLQGIKSVIGELGHIFAGRPHTENTALFARFVLSRASTSDCDFS